MITNVLIKETFKTGKPTIKRIYRFSLGGDSEMGRRAYHRMKFYFA